MRVFYFGSGMFSVPSLRAIAASGHELVGLFTQPARPAGRGGKIRPTPIAEAAGAEGLSATDCPDVNSGDALAAIKAARADVICVVDFGQLIGREVLDAAPLGAVNVHGSLLPELRGAAPVNWAIIRGFRRTGVTTFRIVPRMDAGQIYLQAATDVMGEETAEELRRRLAEMGAKLLCETLELLAGGEALTDRFQFGLQSVKGDKTCGGLSAPGR